jgi:hypothetical protein
VGIDAKAEAGDPKFIGSGVKWNNKFRPFSAGLVWRLPGNPIGTSSDNVEHRDEDSTL